MYIKIYQTYRIDADNWVYQFSYRRYRAAINRVGVPLKTVRDTTQSRSKSLAVRCSYRGDLSPLCRREEGAAAKQFLGGRGRASTLFVVCCDDLAATICQRGARAFCCFSLCRINRTVASSVLSCQVLSCLLIALFVCDVYFVYLFIGGGFYMACFKQGCLVV